MKRGLVRGACRALAGALVGAFAWGCGSRSGLVDEKGPELLDVSQLPPVQPGDAAAQDVSIADTTVVTPVDAGNERPTVADVSLRDASGVPPIDATVNDVAPPRGCADASTTLIYLFSRNNLLLSFDPSTLDLRTIGVVACATTLVPNSMAVDHTGVAYANLIGDVGSGQIWKVSTATASCTSTVFTPQLGFSKLGMGFIGDQNGGEVLYVSDTASPTGSLAAVDVTTFNLAVRGVFAPTLPQCELTGTGDGRLFAFCPDPLGSTIAQVDPATARVLGQDRVAVGGTNLAFAFAYWGGSFWLFTGQAGTTITKFDPVTKIESFVMNITPTIVGAGVSTCAPVR